MKPDELAELEVTEAIREEIAVGGGEFVDEAHLGPIEDLEGIGTRQGVARDVDHRDGKAALREDMRDAVPHLARAKYGNFFGGRHSLVICRRRALRRA